MYRKTKTKTRLLGKQGPQYSLKTTKKPSATLKNSGLALRKRSGGLFSTFIQIKLTLIVACLPMGFISQYR